MVCAALLVLCSLPVFAWESFNREDAALKIHPNAEVGITKVLFHTLQFGRDTTTFDYVFEGGQEILFFYQRYSVDIEIVRRHIVSILYQPLTLNTQTVVPMTRPDGIVIDTAAFSAGEGINLKYGFDFWRFSYLFDFFKDESFMLAAGLSLQFRNASIVFESTDGTGITVNQNLGPVPILKVRSEYRFPCGFFLGLEADGFYASSAIFNGADFQFTGWIYDIALRTGFELNKAVDLYLTGRLLGGGATGNSDYEQTYWTEGTSSYTDNNLVTLNFSAGLRIK